MNRLLLIWFATMTLAASLQGQSFTNLNFESAKIIFVPGSFVDVATSNALPGWSAFNGTNEFSTIPYNAGGGPIPPVGLWGSNSDVLDGNFSVDLALGASISQTGLVPVTTESLLFDSTATGLSVSLGGQNLSYQAIGSGTGSYGRLYTIYGANISPLFAGQMETLTFSGGGFLDDIQFSPEMIPEPSSASLLFLGGGILVYLRKCR